MRSISFFFQFWMGHPPLYVIFSICPSVRPADWPSVVHNISIVGTHVQNDDVWAFLFFHFFKILIFGAVMKNKSYICHVPDLRNSIAWLWLLINLSKMISQGVFFIFPKFWFSGKKMIQNDKKFDHCCPYFRKHSIWPSFVVHKKWWYLLVFFSFFQNLDFSGC